MDNLRKIESFITKHTMLGRSFDKYLLKQSMKVKTPLSNLSNILLVPNPRVQIQLERAFSNPYGGLRVIVSPIGSGKSTYINHQVNEHIHRGGAARLFGSELNNMNDFYTSIGSIERRMDLFDLLPERSVIVLDQLEHLTPFPSEMVTLLHHLACDSRRTAECNVIVVVSDIALAQRILALNGLDKIYQCGTSSDYEWHINETNQFINNVFSHWSEVDKDMIRELGLIAKSPAYMHALYTLYNSTGLPTDPTLLKSARKFGAEWRRYKECGL